MISAKKIKFWFTIILAIFLGIGVVYIETKNISVFSDYVPSAIYSIPTNKKVIALTFDVSWGDKEAEVILRTLKEQQVLKATFFLSSTWAKSHPDVVALIKENGYEIGSHGHKYGNYSEFSEEDIRKQIISAHTILTDLTKEEPHLLRLPHGDFDRRVLHIAKTLNYQVIQWDTDSLDRKNPGVKRIVYEVLHKAHPGDIVLMHANDCCQQTHEALPHIVRKLRQKGYTFATVSELLDHASVKGKEVPSQISIE